jgi:hypothetical protein
MPSFWETRMIGPDDNLSDFPVWVWPYINVARFRAALNPISEQWGTSEGALARHGQGGFEPHSVPGVVGHFVRAAQVKDLAKKIPEGRRKEMTHGAESTIAMLIDDYCGTPPRKWPWPFPGPPPWTLQIATELSLIANTLQSGGLRDEINGIAGQIMSRVGGER